MRLIELSNIIKCDPEAWLTRKNEDSYVALKNFMATTINLWKKKILQDPWCQRCGKQEESVNHALFSCKKSNGIWRLTSFSKDAYTLTSQDLLNGLQQLAEKITKAEMELVVVLCWTTWYARNIQLFENKSQNSQLSVAIAEAMVESYRRTKMPPMQ